MVFILTRIEVFIINKIKELINLFNKFNEFVSDKLSIGLASMYLFWIVFIATIIPGILSPPNSVVGWVQYISSSIFQACALPVLQNSSNKIMNYFQKLLEEVRNTVVNEVTISIKEELEIIKLEQKNQREERNELISIIENIQEDRILDKETNINIKELINEMHKVLTK